MVELDYLAILAALGRRANGSPPAWSGYGTSSVSTPSAS